MGIKLSNGKNIWLWFIDVFSLYYQCIKSCTATCLSDSREYILGRFLCFPLWLSMKQGLQEMGICPRISCMEKSKFLRTFRGGICYIEKDWQIVTTWQDRWTRALKGKRPYLIQTAVMHISCFLHKSYPHIKTLKMVFWRSLNLLSLSQMWPYWLNIFFLLFTINLFLLTILWRMCGQM